MDVGARIKQFRNKRGITVNKLANLSGVSQSYLRDLELGKKQPTVEYLGYICEALGITLSQFFEDNKLKDELEYEISKLNSGQKDALLQMIKIFSK